MSTLRTELCDTLNIAHPIFGFSHEPDVVVAIARAGGFPILGLGRDAPEEIPAIVANVEQQLAGLPYGIDLMLPSKVPAQADPESMRASLPDEHLEFVDTLRQRFKIPAPTQPSFFTSHVRSEAFFEAQIRAVLDSKACAVATAIGIRPELIQAARERKKLTISLVGSVRHAEKALAMGVDVLVAQGYDAGGHTGPIGTMALLPQIIAVAGDKPVLAAGGIATGQQIMGCIGMGAQGGWLGTLWMAAKENHTPPALLQRLIGGASEDTVISRAHSGKPCRVIRSDWIDAWAASDAPAPLNMPLQQVLTGDVFASIHQHNNQELIYEAAGQSIFGIQELTTIAEQMQGLVEGMDTAWARLQNLAQTRGQAS
ncbi:MAG: nitronate monooxygenase [Alcaligenes sp.]